MITGILDKSNVILLLVGTLGMCQSAMAWEEDGYGCWDHFKRNSKINDNCPDPVPYRMRCEVSSSVFKNLLGGMFGLGGGAESHKSPDNLAIFDDNRQLLPGLIQQIQCQDEKTYFKPLDPVKKVIYSNYGLDMANAPTSFWMQYSVTTGDGNYLAHCVHYNKDGEDFKMDRKEPCPPDFPIASDVEAQMAQMQQQQSLNLMDPAQQMLQDPSAAFQPGIGYPHAQQVAQPPPNSWQAPISPQPVQEQNTMQAQGSAFVQPVAQPRPYPWQAQFARQPGQTQNMIQPQGAQYPNFNGNPYPNMHGGAQWQQPVMNPYHGLAVNPVGA